MTRAVAIAACAVLCACRAPSPEARDERPAAAAPVAAALPPLGTAAPDDFPEGPGQATAQESCLVCHSADLARQQRLTEQQWTAVVDKMIRWGTVVPEDRKAELIAYLARHFGPDNDRFVPLVTRPAD
jgi:cytochrome c5